MASPAVTGLFLFLATAPAAVTAQPLPPSFTVYRHGEIESVADRYQCKFLDGGRLRCAVHQLRVAYYRWNAAPPDQPEPQRCNVSSATFDPLDFDPAGIGRWKRREVGLAGLVIETEIIGGDGGVTVRDTVVAGPCRDPLQQDLQACAYGPPGTVTTYLPAPAVGLRLPRKCSSLVLDP